MRRFLVFIFLTLSLAACQTTIRNVSQPSPTVDVPAIQTSAVKTVFADVAKNTATVTRAPSATQTVTVTPKPTHTRSTDTPAPEQASMYNALRSALVVETLEPFEGHTISKMTGSKDGFSGFEWIDPQRLLVKATVNLDGGFLSMYPVMLNLETNNIWLPDVSADMMSTIPNIASYKPYWNHKLNRLISPNLLSSGYVIELYDPNGNLVQSYSGQLTSISPSGTRIMIDDHTWLDLTTGKTVIFTNWDWTMADLHLTPRRIVWSPDEMNVLACCHLYGNVQTGQNFRFDASGDYFDFTDGRWMLNQTYFIPIQGSSRTNYVPAFVPAKQTILNVNKLVGISQLQPDQSRNDCFEWSPSPDERHLLISCTDGSYLVDLRTFTRQAYPAHFQGMFPPPIWSPNGKFALIPTSDAPSYTSYILSIASKKLKPLPEGYADYRCDWDPTENSLVCVYQDDKTLSILDAQTGTITKSLTLPFRGNMAGWSPDGKYAAILCVDSDSGYSLWQIDYPTLENLKQLTPSVQMQGSDYSVAWSPDGNSLAFSFGTDIYIVDTQTKP